MATGTTTAKNPAQAPKPTQAPPANAATPPAAAAPPADASKEAKAQRKEGSYHEFFPTLAEAQAKAALLTKGPRQAFTVKLPDGKEFHLIAAHWHHAFGEVAKKLGWTYVRPEGTSTPRASKPMDPTAMAAVIAAMPKDQQEAAKKQLAELLGLKL